MASPIELRGIFAPVPTPFDASGEIADGALRGLVDRLGASRLSGLLVLGSNGEAVLLDEDESDRVLATAREALPAGKLLLAGVGRESTRATCRAAVRAAAIGVDAVLVRPPSAFRAHVGPDALVAHYRAVADASPVPVVLYNLPGPTGVTLTADVVGQVAVHPNVVGLKETSPDLERLAAFAALPADEFRVLTGWAPVLHPAMVAGAAGGILAVANVIPDACVSLYEHARAGRHDEAAELQRRLTPLAKLVSTGHGVAGLKFALDRLGVAGGHVRSPLRPVDQTGRDAIVAALDAWSD